MRSIFKKIIIYIWIISILINACPVVVLANLLKQEEVSSTVELGTKLTEEIEVIGEIKEKRTLNEKHYLLSDGSMKAVIYPENVHYEENGELVDIDNTLVLKDSTYITKNNQVKSQFAKENSKVDMSYQNHNISWKMLDIQEVNGKVSNSLWSRRIPSIESKITYSDVLENIKLEYEVVSNRIEENIIISSKESLRNTFTYFLETDLELKKEKDNELILLDNKKKEIFYITAPVMYDSNLEFSSDLNFTYQKVKNGYNITLTADLKWLEDEERIYPITIDPIIATDLSREQIVDTYIYPNDASNTGKGNAHILRVGSTSYSDINTNRNPFRSLIKFSLPNLTSGDQIISAELHLFNYQDTDSWNPPSGNIQIDIHAVTKDWNESNAFWNNMKSAYNSEIVDYIKYSYDSKNANKENTADITSLVKNWYVSGNNYGLLLKEHVEKKVSGRNDVSFISSDTSSAYTLKRPYIIIQYRNQTGLENYLTTHQQNIGRTTTYTNDYNGNLTLIHQDTETPGNRLPASIYHVYNTNDKDINIGYGNGFRLNLNQTLESVTISGISYLRYIDEDGTRHYFYKESNIWKDEDGLDLEITASNTNYIMKDKGGNTSTFIKNGNKWYLKEIKDTNNNTITINYSTNYNLITSVVDAVGDTLTLQYTNNLLTTITDKANRTYSYQYSSNQLIGITYPDSLKTGYTYTNKLLTKIKNIDNSSITYEYYNVSPYRIKKVTEYGSNNTLGNSITITYGSTTTTFKDNKGNVESYVFNNLGQTTSINSLDKNSSLKGAYGVSYQYGTSKTDKNKLLLETKMAKTTQNLLLNSSAEKELENWNLVNLGTNQGTISSIQGGYLGTNSFKIESTLENSIPILCQDVSLGANKTYTLSAYLKGNKNAYFFFEYKDSNGTFHRDSFTPLELTDSFERYHVTFTVPSNSSNTRIGIMINEVGEVFADNIQLEEGNSVNPYNILDNGSFHKDTSMWTRTGLTASDKIVSINGISAMNFKGDMASTKYLYQMIPMNGKKGDSYRISFWAKNEGVPLAPLKKARVLLEFHKDGKLVQQLELNVPSDSKTWQYISNEMVAKEDYTHVKVLLTYHYNASNIYYTNIGLYKDDLGSSYTYDSRGNVISSKDLANQNTTYAYDKQNELVKATSPKGRNFYYEYDYHHTNRLLQAFNQKGLTSSYQYDDYGNIIHNKIEEPSMIRDIASIEENTNYIIRPVATNLVLGIVNNNVELVDTNETWTFQKSGDDYIIRSNNNAITVKDSNTANSTNLLVTTVSNNNNQKYKIVNNEDGTFTFQTKVTDYKSCMDIYDGNYKKGSNTQQHQCNQTPAQKFMILPTTYQVKYIESSAEYTENGNYQTKVIDQRGKETTTTYDETKGTITNITDPKGYLTEYTYDTMDNISSIKKGNTINSYTYEKDSLKKITHNGFDYQFNYDEYGNTTSIKVGNTPLITHQYEPNNGYLLKSIYANNNTLEYSYDTFGRINKKINMTGTATYTYNNNGLLSSLHYLNNNIQYTYDLSGRITNIKQNNFHTKYQYDNYNNLNKVNYNYKNNSKEIKYTYDLDDKLKTIDYGTYQINYTYDNLDRLIKKEIVKGEKTYTTTYEYYDIDEYKTTTLLKSITNGTDKYEYSYDNNGNITKVIKNGSTQKRYSYDSLNQLTKVYNGNYNSHTLYTYDTGGNRIKTSKVTYKLDGLLPIYPPNFITTEVLNTYTYDTDWKDQLIQVDDNNITYDELGNMKSYNEYNFSWTNGNELKNITKENDTYEYQYNIDGIRTKKIINGKETNYYLEGSNILYEERDGEVISYLYDESGITGFIKDNKNYYFIKNIQGDIIEVLDEEFNKVAEYTYDSWGVVTVNNLTEENIGDSNPFRYRGYYYDSETGLYYLNSRYYNPILGRFISADSILGANGDILEYNLYTYCSNNPIMYSDPSGNFIQYAPYVIPLIIPFIGPLIQEGEKAMEKGISAIAGAARDLDISLKSKGKKNKGSKRDPEKEKKQYYVYLLTDGKKIQYVGRTKDIKTTKRRHENNPNRAHLDMVEPAFGPMNWYQARGLEEMMIYRHKTLNKNNKTNNQIHGISLENPNRLTYINMGARWYADEHEEYVGG